MSRLFPYHLYILLLAVVVYDVYELKIVDEDKQENDHIEDADEVKVVMLINEVVDEEVMD